MLLVVTQSRGCLSVAPVTPTNPTSTDTQGTSGSGIVALGGSLTRALNGLATSNAVTTSNEIAPGLPSGQTAPSSTTTGTSSGTGLPIGAIAGIIILLFAGIIAYFGRATITAAVNGSERLGK